MALKLFSKRTSKRQGCRLSAEYLDRDGLSAPVQPGFSGITLGADRSALVHGEPPSKLGTRHRRFLAMVKESFSEHRWLLALVGGYGVAALLVSALLGQAHGAWPRFYLSFFASKSIVFLGIFVIIRLLHAMIIVRPERLLQHVWNDFTASAENHLTLARALPFILLLPVFFSIFTSVKVLIPAINPFTWDLAFMEWDRSLHGGVAPWEILHPLVGQPWITGALSFLYYAWFYVMQIVCLWQAFTAKRPQLRTQFFLSFLLVWALLGNVAAILLSSAGPCFFGRVTGLSDPYAALMAYLHTANDVLPVWSLQIQEWLWQGYLQPDFGVTKGISAMPSVHVAIAFLFALFGWRVNRILGALFTAFWLVTMIGSVHLGWHYAIDGYVSMAATYLIWRIAGWMVRTRVVGRAQAW
jgi:PAP2 superfamily